MRWKAKRESRIGDVKIIRRFLLLPKTIDGETRWLERAAWIEVEKCYARHEVAWDCGSARVRAAQEGREAIEQWQAMSLTERFDCLRLRSLL